MSSVQAGNFEFNDNEPTIHCKWLTLIKITHKTRLHSNKITNYLLFNSNIYKLYIIVFPKAAIQLKIIIIMPSECLLYANTCAYITFIIIKLKWNILKHVFYYSPINERC